MLSKSFTTGSLDTDTYLVLSESPCSDPNGDRRLRLFATTEDAVTDTAIVGLALILEQNGSKIVIARKLCTVTGTARRGATGGAAGAYICDCAWADGEGGSSTVSLLGSFDRKDSNKAYWAIGVQSYTGSMNDVILYCETDSHSQSGGV